MRADEASRARSTIRRAAFAAATSRKTMDWVVELEKFMQDVVHAAAARAPLGAVDSAFMSITNRSTSN